MVVFLLILILGYVYAWAKGDLEWDKPKPKYLGFEREKREIEEVQA